MMVQTIGWALVHSIWQAGLVAGIVALLLFGLRGASAAARYWVAVGGMAVMVFAPMATVALTRSAPSDGIAAPGATFERTDLRRDPVLSKSTMTARNAGPSTKTTVEPELALRASVERLFPWMVGLWIAGVIAFSVRTIFGVVWARRLTRIGTQPVTDSMRGAAARIAESMGVRVMVRVLESSRVTVPMVVGWLRPVILMPAPLFTGLMPQQIEAILAHELAHVRRNDYFVNLLQTVIDTLYFFHPAAWWLSGRIREERENACDELAVAACGGDRVFYSRVLLTVEEQRGEAPLLAVAASGGSLSRRIYRLLGAQEAHLDIGPRWYAGVFTIALAVVTAGGVVEDRVHTPERAVDTFAQDTAKARPSTVIKSATDGDLATRWEWAMRHARQSNFKRYWVGYLIDGDESGQTWLYFDRHVPVRLGESMIMGGLRMSGPFGSVKVSGVPLENLIGNYEPYHTAVFIGFDGERFQRLHLGSVAFPMNFANAPLLWLGPANDAESIQQLAQLDERTRDPQLREDLAAFIGAHMDGRVAIPILERWATDRDRPADVRDESIESLSHFDDPRVLGVLARIARSNESEDIRREAIESIGNMNVRESFDTLSALLQSLPSDDLKREVIESLANLQDERGVASLRRIIEDRSLSSDLRSEALEQIAGHSDSPDILKDLAVYATRSDVQDIQREAIEAMTEVAADDRERVATLIDVVNTHPDPEIQARAAEAIGEVRAHDVAIEALKTIITQHRSEDVRRRAVEGLSTIASHDMNAAHVLVAVVADAAQLGDVRRAAAESIMQNRPAEEAIRFARRLMDSDAPFDVKREVLEALDEVDGGAGIPVLIEIARSTKDPELRKRALEALIESDDPRAVAALRRVVE